jgi:hypothetical protein
MPEIIPVNLKPSLVTERPGSRSIESTTLTEPKLCTESCRTTKNYPQSKIVLLISYPFTGKTQKKSKSILKLKIFFSFHLPPPCPPPFPTPLWRCVLFTWLLLFFMSRLWGADFLGSLAPFLPRMAKSPLLFRCKFALDTAMFSPHLSFHLSQFYSALIGYLLPNLCQNPS